VRPFIDAVQNAGAVLGGGGPGLRIQIRIQAAVEAFEDQARVHLGGHRRGGAAPRHAVLIDATVAGVAATHGAGGFASQFEGGEAGLGADRLGRHLVHRNAELNVGAGGLFGTHAGQIGAAGAGVVATAAFSGVVRHAGQHEHILAEGFEGLEGFTIPRIRLEKRY
jgi:hypothetical protein